VINLDDDYGDDSFVDYDLLIVWKWILDNANNGELVNILLWWWKLY